MAAGASSATEVLAELHQAGVAITLERGQVRLRGPSDRLPAALLERLRAEKPALLVLLTNHVRAEIAAWAPEHRDAYEERAAILEHEAGQPRAEAEQAAYLAVREAIAAEQELAERVPLTAAEAEELFAWPAWVQGTWQLEVEHRVAQGASRPAAERQALEAVRALRLAEPPARREGAPPPRCSNPRCTNVPNLLGLRFCPNCQRRRNDARRPSAPRPDLQAQEDTPIERGASERRLAVRPVVSPRTCGGCGCKALGDEGRGPCGRCGWRCTSHPPEPSSEA